MKNIKYLIFTLFVTLFGVINVNAGSMSLQASTSVTVGNTVTIKVNTSNVAGRYSLTSLNSSVLSGGTSSAKISYYGESATYQFKANQVGSATIKLNPIDMASSDETEYTTSSSITINVVPKKQIVLSGDNSLSSLGVDGYELSPGFSTDNLEYSVNIKPDTSKINITASASHGSASINGSGEKDVNDGANRFEIVVTAENGSTRTYIINANVEEYNPITVKVDNEEYTVVRKKSQITAPNNYEETTVKINDEEVPAFKSKITKYTLVGLKDKSGNIVYYVYDTKKQTYTLYKEYKFNRIVLYPLESNDIPGNYKKTTIKYNDEKIVAYKLKKKSKYALIYGMNIETGEKNLYMYDSKEDTLQIYNDEEVKVLKNENNMYLKIIIGLSTLSVVLIILTIVAFVKKNKK